MDNNKKAIIEKRINAVGEKLRKNNMEFYYAETKEDVCPIVASLIKKGDVINSNRIAAIAYGPKSVIIIAGYNKIVRDLNEAEIRVKREAAPPNCVRLNCETYCKEKGECVSLSKADRQISDGCGGDGRISAAD